MPYLEWLALLSVFTFFLSIILIPWYVCRLPRNYFLDIQAHHFHFGGEPLHIFFVVLRNLAGLLLIAAGFAMLFLPGQGIITMLIGILCMNFPGKRALLLYIISRPTIQHSLDWARKKMHCPPFHWHE